MDCDNQSICEALRLQLQIDGEDQEGTLLLVDNNDGKEKETKKLSER